MLQGLDNGDARAHKPQQLRRRCHLALSAGGCWAAGKVNHFLEWSGEIEQGNCLLENPWLLLTDEVFTKAGRCRLVLLNPGPWRLWINFYRRGTPHGSARSAFLRLWRRPVVKCPIASWVPSVALKLTASWGKSPPHGKNPPFDNVACLLPIAFLKREGPAAIPFLWPWLSLAVCGEPLFITCWDLLLHWYKKNGLAVK